MRIFALSERMRLCGGQKSLICIVDIASIPLVMVTLFPFTQFEPKIAVDESSTALFDGVLSVMADNVTHDASSSLTRKRWSVSLGFGGRQLFEW